MHDTDDDADALNLEEQALLARLAEIRRRRGARAGGVDIGGDADIDGDVVGGHKTELHLDRMDVQISYGAYDGPAPRDPAQALSIYRRVLAARTALLPLRGADRESADATSSRADLSLAGVYIALDTDLRLSAERIDQALRLVRTGEPGAQPDLHRLGDTTRAEPEHGRRDDDSRAVTALEQAVLSPRLVLLGAPGAGKSTFVNHLAHHLATGEPPQCWPWDDTLPVLVVLRELAAWLGDAAARKPSAAVIADFAAHDLTERNLGFAAAPVAEAIEAGRALLLLDGLDEVPATRLDTVRDSIAAYAQRYPSCRLLVTCRVRSYEDPAFQLPARAFQVARLAPFDDAKIDAFVDAWYAEVAARWQVPAVKAQEKAAKLRTAVRRADLRDLAPNPLLLTVMALVHTQRGELPQARARLYDEAIDVLLWLWERDKHEGEPRLILLLREAGRDPADLLGLLEQAAFDAHAFAAGAGADRSSDTAAIDELTLLKALRRLHPDRSLDWAEAVVETLKLRAGLLVEERPGVLGFPHRTFQEYLAGACLARRRDFAAKAAALARTGSWWREAILLAVGHLVYSQRDPERPRLLIEELCPDSPPDSPPDAPPDPDDAVAWRLAWLAGAALLELGVARAGDTAHGRRLLERVRHRLTDLLEQGRLAPAERAAAGDVLGQLGDPRFAGPLLLPSRFRGQPEPLLGLVEVPAGPFVMGSPKDDTEAYDDEYGNPRSLTMPHRYWISRYPVTVGQFAAFIEAGGYRERRWWTKAGWDLLRDPRTEPAGWIDQRPYSNRPVVLVTWLEAMAYAAWLDAAVRAQAPDRLPTGYVLRLPTEAEWECAARGATGRRYAWGDGWDPARANVDMTIGSSSPVGAFPAGATPTGIMDLTGNCWEWCLSAIGDYPYRPDKQRNEPERNTRRVLRGGAWVSVRHNARAANRFRYVPVGFNYDVGFRLVLSLADSEF